MTAAAPLVQSIEADGVVTSGVLNTPWFFLTVPPGIYDLDWIVWLDGTLAATVDRNNIDMITSNNTSNFVAQAMCRGAAGYYPQMHLHAVSVLPGQSAGHYLALQPSPNTPSVGAVYGGSIVATLLQAY